MLSTQKRVLKNCTAEGLRADRHPARPRQKDRDRPQRAGGARPAAAGFLHPLHRVLERARAPRARAARALTCNSGTDAAPACMPARDRQRWRGGRRCLPVPGQSKRRGSSEGRHAPCSPSRRAPRTHVFAPTLMACLARKTIVGRAATVGGMHHASPRRNSAGRARCARFLFALCTFGNLLLSPVLLSRRRGGGVTDEGICRLAGSAGEQRRTTTPLQRSSWTFGVKKHGGPVRAPRSAVSGVHVPCAVWGSRRACRARSLPGRRADDGDARGTVRGWQRVMHAAATVARCASFCARLRARGVDRGGKSSQPASSHRQQQRLR